VSTRTPCWEPVPFVLAYRIGEITLFRTQWRGLALHEHFFDLTTDPNEPHPPIERLRKDTEVIITRSHPVRESLPVLTMQGGALRYVMAQYTRYYTELTGDFDSYLAKFSAKTRNTLRRKVRRFLELGNACAMREYKRPEEMEEFQRLAGAVSVLTYQEKLFDAGLPLGPEFLGELIDLAKLDSVRAYVLSIDGRAIAYLCCPVVNGVLLYSYLGYDPSYGHLSPGTVLQYLVFETLFGQKAFRAFDFTEGQGEHKKFFATQKTPCADICYFRDAASARFWVGLHRGVGGLSMVAGRALETLGMKSVVKRFLRRL
jgi:CelD/BcsL family acetyltransferase involved in cellulose biosynthesis